MFSILQREKASQEQRMMQEIYERVTAGQREKEMEREKLKKAGKVRFN